MNEPIQPVMLRHLQRHREQQEDRRALIVFFALVAFCLGLLLG